MYDNKLKTSSSYIEFNNHKNKIIYGQIQLFIVTNDNRKLCLVETLKIDESKSLHHRKLNIRIKHIIPFVRTNDLMLITLDEIVETVIRVTNFLCKRPNSVEKKL